MEIIFVRHIPTDNNLSDSFVGRLDLPCNKQYIAEHSNDILKAQRQLGPYSAVFSSPLKRAQETAKLLVGDSDIIIDQRLCERDIGEWNDKPKSVVQALQPEAFFSNGEINFAVTPNGGESFSEFIVRVASFINDTEIKFGINNRVIAVTHNGIITAAKCIANKDVINPKPLPFQPYLMPYVFNISDDVRKYVRDLLSEV